MYLVKPGMSCCGCHITTVTAADADRAASIKNVTIPLDQVATVDEVVGNLSTQTPCCKIPLHCNSEDADGSKLKSDGKQRKRKCKDTAQEDYEANESTDIFEFLAPSDLRLTPQALIETHISHFRCNVNGNIHEARNSISYRLKIS